MENAHSFTSGWWIWTVEKLGGGGWGGYQGTMNSGPVLKTFPVMYSSLGSRKKIANVEWRETCKRGSEVNCTLLSKRSERPNQNNCWCTTYQLHLQTLRVLLSLSEPVHTGGFHSCMHYVMESGHDEWLGSDPVKERKTEEYINTYCTIHPCLVTQAFYLGDPDIPLHPLGYSPVANVGESPVFGEAVSPSPSHVPLWEMFNTFPIFSHKYWHYLIFIQSF